MDLVVGYKRTNTSPILKLLLSKMDALTAGVAKKLA
jgi:LysR family hca operon transcriptional activator